MRLGSRRNQRPNHQKMRSSTTVSATIETMRIGHMIGPPRLNLSTNQTPLVGGAISPVSLPPTPGEAAVAGEALNVAVTLVPGAGGAPVVVAGDIAGAPGAAGPPAGGGFTAGFAGAPG